jgi:hypothetical protein
MIENYFYNLARLSYLSRWRRDKKKGRTRKIIAGGPTFHGGQHASAHHVEGGMMLRTPPWKATNDY